ncbi:MAG: DEAD/DEAH box helicase, partial [Comamonas sp.]
RELAQQTLKEVERFAQFTFVKSGMITGGEDFKEQAAMLRKVPDILVGTPGRMLEQLNAGNLKLEHVQVVVLDEADRMLDMGFIHDIRRVLAKLPSKRQNLLFSATFSDEIKELANKLLTNPASVEVARRNTASEQVEQSVHFVDKRRKRELLAQLIGTHNWQQVLVFTRTKYGANHLAEQLNKDGITAAAIHGNKS